MDSKKYNDFVLLIRQFCDDINVDNYSHKSLDVTKVHQYVIFAHQEATNDLNLLLVDQKAVEGELYDKYKDDPRISYTKQEIEGKISQEDRAIQIRKDIAQLKSQIIGLENTMTNLSAMSYNVKNFIEGEKFYAGQ